MAPLKPTRKEMLEAIKMAERALEDSGSNWAKLPGVIRYPMLKCAHLLARLIAKSQPPKP